ncbi:unnamed protein product [Linum tenue]|uniref:Phospholipid/glycerol acyltransferase domain-containing protein n=1 Tax=Linum tenue TaxID=586396 RepID=A0AAV0MMW5_9ROSI|nr:unnamed protein product [Linum tenue]
MAAEQLITPTTTTTLIFQLEETLLRSPSLFPYFTLVALETGGILRAFLLGLFYPLLRFVVGRSTGIKLMTFLCFAGLKTDRVRLLGRSVLPKWFLDDVGLEGLENVMSRRQGEKLMAVSDLPRVMVEGFARDYLGVATVVGREVKEVNGYFVGLMEEDRREERVLRAVDEVASNIGDGGGGGGGEIYVKEKSVGVGAHHRLVGVVGCRDDDVGGVGDHHIFRNCEKVHVVRRSEKKQWSALPRNKYPKPLIFHDGRLAFRPTFPATLALFMWVPFGFLLVVIRFLIGRLLPFPLVIPCLSLTGMRFVFTGTPPPPPPGRSGGGTMYVCNHRTLLDPIVIALALLNTTATAVTYSVSKFNEVISPVRNVPLTRDRERDGRIMEEILRHGDVVVCPEGTTCREPYLLRFSPLFAEVAGGSAGKIVPVAVNVGVSMFYGSTASGLKLLDPAFHLLNPCPLYSANFLVAGGGGTTTSSGRRIISATGGIEVANSVQKVIGDELGFQCTSFTRKDKYMVLAGNTGVISSSS